MAIMLNEFYFIWPFSALSLNFYNRVFIFKIRPYLILIHALWSVPHFSIVSFSRSLISKLHLTFAGPFPYLTFPFYRPPIFESYIWRAVFRTFLNVSFCFSKSNTIFIPENILSRCNRKLTKWLNPSWVEHRHEWPAVFAGMNFII